MTVVASADSVSQENSSYLTLNGVITVTSYSENIHKYSAPGWGLGAGFARDLGNYARLVVEGTYQRFAVDKERVYSNRTNSESWPIQADASQVYEGRVGFQIAFTTNAVRPYASIGGGAMLLKSGTISFSRVDPSIVRGGSSQTLGFVFLGLGLEFPVADFLSSSVSTEISTPFNIKGVSLPITSRWYFRL